MYTGASFLSGTMHQAHMRQFMCLAHVVLQAQLQLRSRLSKGGEMPAEETMQWFLRDRY
jgi:hypothetical protein